MSDFDLATLKIEVDTTDLKTATAQLTAFADASKKLSATEIANEKLALAQRKQSLSEHKQAISEKNSAQRAAAAETKRIALEEDVYARAGIKSLEVRREKVLALGAAMKQLHADHAAGTIVGKEYSRMHDDITKAQNLAIHGNSRHRGAIRQTAAAMASLTFEMTGALYGVIALGSALAAPAFFGVGLMRSMEDTKLGMAAILISMGRINGEAIQLPQALEVSGKITRQLQQDALKYGISISELAKTMRATLAPGLAAGLDIKQIQQIATIGTLAVKTIGLDSRQAVQEIRDLVAGGIQAASSTLATSIGVKDSDIKRWREAGILYDELMKKLVGFSIAGVESTKTLSGAWDTLLMKVQLLFASEKVFDGLKNAVISLSNFIMKPGTMELNPRVVSIVENYIAVLTLAGEAIVTLVKAFGMLLPAINILMKIGEAMAIAWGATKLFNIAIAASQIGILAFGATVKTITSLTAATSLLTAETILMRDAAVAAGVASTASNATIGAAMTGLWAKAGTFGKYGIVGLALWGLYELADMTGFIDRIFNNVNVKLDEYKKKISAMSLDAAKIEQKTATAEYEKTKASYDKARSTGMSMSWGGAADVDAALKKKRAVDLQVEQLTKEHEVVITGILKDSSEEWNNLNMTKTQQLEKEIKKQNDIYLKQSAALMQSGKTDEEIQKSQIELAQDYAVKMDVLMGKQKASKIELTEQEKIDIQIQKDIIAEYERKVKQMDSNNDSLAKSNDALRIHNSEIGKTKEEIANLAVERENHAIKMDEESLAVLDATLVCSAESEALRENIKLRKERRELSGHTAISEATDAANKAEIKAAEDKWKMIDGFAHTAFNNILDKGKNTFKEIGDAIKKYLLDMLYKMTVQKFLINIGVAGAGAGGAGGAMASMMGGDAGGGGSWLSAGKSFYDGLSGAFTYSSTATTGLSGMFNSFATSGLGQSLGLSTAGELSLATGEFAQSVSSLGSTVGTIGSYVGAGLAGISLGTMIAGDKKLFGIDGKSAAMMGTAIGMAVGGPLGAVVGGVIGGIANAAFGMGPKQSGTTTLAGQFSGQGFAGQYETPWSQKGGWFRSNKSGVDVQGIGAEQAQAFQNVIAGTEFVFAKLAAVSGEATIALDTWSFAINRQVATQEQQNSLVIDIANSMGAHMIPRLSQFQKAGENLADTAVRLSDEVILLNKLFYALGSTSRATIDSADALATALGGVANSAQLMTSFISGFAPVATQTALTLESLTNAGLPMAQFLTTTEAWWAFAQTASTEQLTAILANQGAIKSWVDAMDKSSQAVKDNIKALQDKAVADFKAASDAVASLRTFGASVRDLMRSLWLGAQSPLTSTYGASRAEFLSTNAAAVGDVTAQGRLAGSATAFLDASKLQARSSVDYARDFAMVQNALGATADATDIQVTVADAQLTVLELISSTMTNLLAETAAGNMSNVANLQESYAALLSVQNEINAAKIAGTLDVDVLRGTVISATAQQISGVDNVNKSVLRITDPSGLLIGASNAIRTEVINGSGYTAKVTDTLNAATNPILDEMSAWLNSINTESTIQTDSLIYLLNTAIATNQAASDAANAQMAADAQKALIAQDAIRSATATAEAARIAAETAAAVATSLPNVYSASNPNPTLVAARDAAIATAQSAMDAAMMADYGRDYGGRAWGRAISAAQATLTSAQSLPAFASGGIHEGGWRMVGENGPEIEYTPPSRIFSNSESRGMMAANDETANEVKQLRAELQAIGLALAKNTGEAAKILRKFDGDGLPAERVIAA